MYYDRKNIYITDDKKTLFDLNKNDIYEINENYFKKFEKMYYIDNPHNILIDEDYKEIYELFFKSHMYGLDYKFSIYQIKINTSSICNLECKYCDRSKWNSDIENKVMSKDIAEKICNFICDNFYNLTSIVFYGGEPLLGIDAIEVICENLNHKNIDFSIYTNLTILNDRIIEIINRYNIKIIASIDGPKEIHDANRMYGQTNMGTYKTIYENVKKLKEKTNSFNAIAAIYTLPAYQKYTKQQIVEFLSNEYNVKNVSIGDVETNDITLKIPNNNRFNEKRIEKEVKELYANIINDKYVDLGYISIPLTTFFSKCNGENFCTAGITSIVIMPNGDMWPCRAFIGNKEFYMGNINCNNENINLIKFKRVKKSLISIQKSKIHKCNNCIAKFWCVKCLGNKRSSKEDILNNIINENCEYNEKLTFTILENLGRVLENQQFQILHDNLEKCSKYSTDKC